MALGNRKNTKRFFRDRTDYGIVNDALKAQASSSLVSEDFANDPAQMGFLAPTMYRMDLIDEDIDEIRRYASSELSGGSGGGLTETPLAMISGRWQWSSTDSGERLHVGNSSYGPFGFYLHTQEPVDANIRSYDARDSVNSTTGNIYPYFAQAMGIWCPDNGKKVKVKFSFRIQSAPNSSTWGISLWDCDDPSNGSSTFPQTRITLRAKSPDVTVDTTSTKYWTTTTTTTNTVGDKWLVPMLENRSGTLTTNTYIYGQVALYLVD